MGVCFSHPSASRPYDYEAALHRATTPNYSTVINPAEKVTGETHTRRHPVSAVKGLCTAVYPEEAHPVQTIWDGFQRGVRVSAASPCLGTRPFHLNPDDSLQVGKDGYPVRGDYVWDTYAEVDAEAREVGIGLALLGYEPYTNVGVYSKNRHEWIATWLGLSSRAMRVVALYDTLGPEAVQFIMEHADIQCMFVDSDKMPALFKVIDTVKARHVIQYDTNPRWGNVQDALNPAHVEALSARGITLLSYSALRASARGNTTVFPAFPKPDDLAYIMYTSGTTGNPKGALLSHAGLCASVEAARHILSFDGSDVHLSYLPLAHIFETGVQVVFLSSGARIGFFSGIIKKMPEDLQHLRPTALFGVPRVFQRIHQNVFANINAAPALKKRLALNAYDSQVEALRQGKDISGNFLANKIMGGIRAKIGLDRCRQIATAAAPCPPYIMEFLVVLIGARVIQGYGLTETHAAVSSSLWHDSTRGHVGGPLMCSEVKLVDIPEMGYTSLDTPWPRGEIWVRGPQLFKVHSHPPHPHSHRLSPLHPSGTRSLPLLAAGCAQGYYKDEANTRESLKEGGWLATGDVGRWNENGSLSIIDRRKNIFKLSQGEYVAAEAIEGVYAKSPLVSAVFVYGNSFKSFLLGVVSPAADYWVRVWKERGWWNDVTVGSDALPARFAEVWKAHEADCTKEVVASLQAQQRELKGFEVVRDWIVECEVDRDGNAFTPQNGLMTPTFKMRRPQMLHRYVRQLKQLYGKHGEPPADEEHWPGE